MTSTTQLTVGGLRAVDVQVPLETASAEIRTNLGPLIVSDIR